MAAKRLPLPLSQQLKTEAISMTQPIGSAAAKLLTTEEACLFMGPIRHDDKGSVSSRL